MTALPARVLRLGLALALAAPLVCASAVDRLAAAEPKADRAPPERKAAQKQKPAPKTAVPKPKLDALTAELGSLRERMIAAAEDLQQKEQAFAKLARAVAAMNRGVTAESKDLAESRKEQELLLGALERLARAPPEALSLSPEGPIDRQRSGVLIAAAVPALAAQARDLGGQINAMVAVRSRIDARQSDVDSARTELDERRQALAEMTARRREILNQVFRDNGKAPELIAADAVPDIFNLLKRADAENDRRDQDLAARLAIQAAAAKKNAEAPADPTRPQHLREFAADRTTILLPVAGDVIGRFADAAPDNKPSEGVTLSALANAVAVAPFDGRVDFVGSLRGYGLVLIIRHGAGYHSLLAGLGRVDVTSGEWLLAGEPVGALPGGDGQGIGSAIFFELLREGRPIDPLSRLAGSDGKSGNDKVRE